LFSSSFSFTFCIISFYLFGVVEGGSVIAEYGFRYNYIVSHVMSFLFPYYYSLIWIYIYISNIHLDFVSHQPKYIVVNTINSLLPLEYIFPSGGVSSCDLTGYEPALLPAGLYFINSLHSISNLWINNPSLWLTQDLTTLISSPQISQPKLHLRDSIIPLILVLQSPHPTLPISCLSISPATLWCLLLATHPRQTLQQP
jgi:hypothetical protein